MVSKQLIITADDFNADAERNRGILEASDKGILTTTSVISNLPLDSGTVTALKNSFNGIGIHLNITKGAPLSTNTKTLVDKNGQFFDKQTAWKKALSKLYDHNELLSEFSAQVEMLLDNGIVPDHIDSNNHLHVFPVFADITAQIANKYKIKFIRLPKETFYFSDINFSKTFIKKYFVYSLSLIAKKFFVKAGLGFTDYFNGIAVPSLLSKESMLKFIKHLPPGTTELMCHPGYPSTDNPFSNSDREKELLILTDKDIMSEIKMYNIEIISFSDIKK
jgi:predicted glycoside hydrolase/deacetylase ChbG (UPF0249 family)